MLAKLQELVQRICDESCDPETITPTELAYLENIEGLDWEQIGNFNDDGSGATIALAYDVAKTLGATKEQLDHYENEWLHRQAGRTRFDSSPHDFSHSGLGIGGLGTYEEPPFIPSVAAIERVQRLEDTDIVCKRCGSSMNFDGAMFTNGGGNICDDCF